MVELSPRQKEVIAFMLKGMMDKEIAVNMGIGIEMVRKHINKVIEKTGGKLEHMLCVRLSINHCLNGCHFLNWKRLGLAPMRGAWPTQTPAGFPFLDKFVIKSLLESMPVPALPEKRTTDHD